MSSCSFGRVGWIFSSNVDTTGEVAPLNQGVGAPGLGCDIKITARQWFCSRTTQMRCGQPIAGSDSYLSYDVIFVARWPICSSDNNCRCVLSTTKYLGNVHERGSFVALRLCIAHISSCGNCKTVYTGREYHGPT